MGPAGPTTFQISPASAQPSKRVRWSDDMFHSMPTRVVRMNNCLLFALTGIFRKDMVGVRFWGEKCWKVTYGISYDTSFSGKTISFEAALSTVHRLHGAPELGCSAGWRGPVKLGFKLLFFLRKKCWKGSVNSLQLQGGLDPNKISGVGTDFGLLVHVLPGPNKQRGLKPSMLLSWILRQNN
jgi:hypothetical protein